MKKRKNRKMSQREKKVRVTVTTAKMRTGN
jgi:hypothetical protein